MLLALGSAFAQTNELKFTKQEVFNDYKIVNFVLDKSMDKADFKKIIYDIKNSKNPFELSLESNNTCKARVSLNTTPNDILVFLKKYDYDFAYEVIKEIGQKTNSQVYTKLPAHYPKKIKADGKEVDEASYQQAIEFWKKRYPKEWEEYKKNNQNTIN